MRCIGYIRVSTNRQRDEGSSLSEQRQRITDWCTANGHELVTVFADEGLSGRSTDRRPGVQQAIKAACREKGSLVAVSLARICRSTSDALSIAHQLDRAGASLVSLSEMIATDSASGRLIFRLLAALAEFEAELISERTATVLGHLRANGQRVSGMIPYGSDLAPDGQALVPNDQEQRVIEQLHRRRSEGASFRLLAEELEQQGVRTKSGKCKWMPKVIRAILLRDRELRSVHAA